MFLKTSSRIKQFMSTKKNKKLQEGYGLPRNDARQKRELSPHLWISQNRKSMDDAFVRRASSNTAVQTSSPPLPSPLSPQYSLRSFCECGCISPIASTPHSLLKIETGSKAPQDLYLGKDESLRLFSISGSSLVTTLLSPGSSSDDINETASTLQIDLLEALALEPVQTPRQNPPSRNPNCDHPSKGTQLLSGEANCAIQVSSAAAKNGEVCLNKGLSSLTTRKMSPRIEPRQQCWRPHPINVTLTRPVSPSYLEHEEGRAIGPNSVQQHSPADTLQTLAEMSNRSILISSRDRFRDTIANTGVESVAISRLNVESFDENSLRPSSETSRSTASGSTGSTPLEPFHLEGLPLRIKLAEGLLTEGHGRKHTETRRSAPSSFLPQNPVASRSFTSTPMVTEVKNSRCRSLSKREVVLKSTNFSLTSLGFRHGDIRLEGQFQPGTVLGTKSILRSSPATFHVTGGEENSSSASRVDDEGGLADEELDLPGFQMAISGASIQSWTNECDDQLTEGRHPGLEELEVKFDELMEWCSDLGLDSGRMVQCEPVGEKEAQNGL